MPLALIREIQSADLWKPLISRCSPTCRKLIKVILQSWQADIVLVSVHPENLFDFLFGRFLSEEHKVNIAPRQHVMILYFQELSLKPLYTLSYAKKVDFGSSANEICF